MISLANSGYSKTPLLTRSKMSKYEVLLMPTHIGGIIDKHNNIVKPFIDACFPDELVIKMGWDKKIRLELTVEKRYLKIAKSESDESELFYNLGEFRYVRIEENEG